MNKQRLYGFFLTVFFFLTAWPAYAAIDIATVQKLLAGDRAADEGFGWRVSVDGDTVIIGTPGDDAMTGSAYVFIHSGNTWTQQAKIVAKDRAVDNYFGISVSLSGDTAVIGAGGDDSDTGSAYVFTRSGEIWTQQAKLIAKDGTKGDDFGVTVSVSGDTVVIGADGDDSATGAAYAYDLSSIPVTYHSNILFLLGL